MIPQYVLIGYPLGHSLSPEIHARLFELEGIQADYGLDAFPPEEFDAHLPILRTYQGFNVTIPFKCKIVPHLSGMTESAQLYGSVNAVHSDPQGNLYGDNTDSTGFLRTMELNNIRLNTSVCVLGAGGVGRMFAIECARQGSDVTVAVRASGRQKAAALEEEILQKLQIQIKVQEIAELQGPFGLVINATPVGMFPNADACPVSRKFLESVETVFDCIYNPEETLLLRYARELGKRTAGGMDMLVWQAAIAHERWHGSQFDPEQMAKIITDMSRLLRKRSEAHE